MLATASRAAQGSLVLRGPNPQVSPVGELAGAGSTQSRDVLDAIDPDVIFMGVGKRSPYGDPDLSAKVGHAERAVRAVKCAHQAVVVIQVSSDHRGTLLGGSRYRGYDPAGQIDWVIVLRPLVTR